MQLLSTASFVIFDIENTTKERIYIIKKEKLVKFEIEKNRYIFIS